uniref:Uncharacterized protein n=1 Tax=Arundo donax TaxID=35708 RepID=A0A0A9EYF5_ARUDO
MSQRCSPITPFQYKTRTIYNINPVEVQKGDICFGYLKEQHYYLKTD